MSDNPLTSESDHAGPPEQTSEPTSGQAAPVTSVQTKPRPRDRFAEGLLFNLIIPLAMVVGAVLLVLFMGKATPPPRSSDDSTLAGRMEALTPVRVAELKSLQATGEQLQLEVDGNVVPYREARVAAEVAGRVVFKDENCEAGAVVKKGDVLMRIDPTDYKLEVDRLTRQKEQAYQSLMEADQEMVNANRLIKVAEQDVALQEAEVRRQESLPKNFSSRKEVDTAKRGLLQSQQALVNNMNQLDLLKKRRVRLEASEAVAVTALKSANLNLKRTEITAPIDGVIVSEEADLNTFVNRGTPLLTIEDTSKVEVATSLRMDQLYWVLDQHDGARETVGSNYDLPETPAIIEYQLTGRSDQSYQWNGRLLSYDGIGLDAKTRTVPVRVLVDNPQKFASNGGEERTGSGPTALIRGMYVRVKLLITPKTPLVVIPGNALQPGNRVLQFVKDDSVLESPKPKDKTTTVSDDNTQEEAKVVAEDVESAGQEAATKFDPKGWMAGRIVVQSKVIPVDTLTITGDAYTVDDEQDTSDLGSRARYWVCETGDKTFGESSFVVTSPVGSVDEAGMPARAEEGKTASEGESNTEPKDENTKSEPTKPPATADATPKLTAPNGDAV